MAIPGIDPFLRVVGLFSPGVPNQERILVQPNFKGSLAGSAIAVGFSAGAAGALPLFDNIFWFPDIIVEPPSWIYVYTGKGTMQQTRMLDGEPALVLHWQRQHTVFNSVDLVPFLIQVSDVAIFPRIPHRDR